LLDAVSPGRLFVSGHPGCFWEQIERELPDVIVIDFSALQSELLGLSVRQDQRTSRLPLLVANADTEPQAFLPDGILDLKAEAGVIARLLRSHHLRHFRLRSQIETDELTGLFSRRKARAKVSSMLRLAARQRAPLALAVLDLDHFKSVNDTISWTSEDSAGAYLRRPGALGTHSRTRCLAVLLLECQILS
jgi:PleD family two-component response regulator